MYYAICFRPHCGGYEYNMKTLPVSLSQLYTVSNHSTKAFSCECPDGITGDRCESCVDVPDIFRFEYKPGVCADCACADLSKNKKCDKETGQCSCFPNVDVNLAGKKCVSCKTF